MAWPKGRPRRTVPPMSKATHTEPAPLDVLAMRRKVCALRVRRHPIPVELAAFDWLPFGKIARVIRHEMGEAGADDSQVEAFVEKYVTTVG